MIRLAAAFLFASALPGLASQCIQLAGDPQARIWRAALTPDEVRIVFVGHSAFRIETGQGRVAVTDFYGDAGPGPVPDAVTMNHAHSSHWTPAPDEAIAHPLKGWAEGGTAASHWVQLDDLLIRNVPTDIRDFGGVWEDDGNSIFIFEYEGLCIGHLGHLHHILTDEDYAQIGRLDVVLVPVDGGYTMAVSDMLTIMKRLRARLVIPMHIFRSGSLERFLVGMAPDFRIDMSEASDITISARTLPSEPTVRVLAPAIRDGGWGLD